MASAITIKQVPVELLEQLRQRAKQNHRSLQGELLTILEQAIGSQERMTPLAALERARARRSATQGDSVEIIRKMRDAR